MGGNSINCDDNKNIKKIEESIDKKNYPDSFNSLNVENEESKNIVLGDIVSMKNSTKTFDCYAIISNIFRIIECNELYCQVYWLVPTKHNFLSDFKFVQKVPKNSPYRFMYDLNYESIEEEYETTVKPFDWDKTCFDYLKKE
ncbi:Hypothetical protein SRAE_2000261700 [Strongyloides ratti]|uniref:BAH domain-containing protein n=1 Tax=Strongyloides ratti TaxID=34506 RepID=A0A090LDT0_STRRB|nr:Hypothetical protein SRAE_2000261700 [Strongyloides ratti]CEF67956.1 Hypothetical protein SRAE_2000261700 [Strongyloides ratti]